MSLRGVRAPWSPLETHLKIRNLVWAEPPPDDTIVSLVDRSPEREDGQHLWACGDPGLLIASFDVASGKLTSKTVPCPTSAPRVFESPGKTKKRAALDIHTLFSELPSTKAVCLACVGRSQLWVGTERGSLHAIDVPGFYLHDVAQLDDAVLSIVVGTTDASSPEASLGSFGEDRTSSGRGSTSVDDVPQPDPSVPERTESGVASDDLVSGPEDGRCVIVGLANGYVVKFTGQSDKDGGMEAPFDREPQMVRLGRAPVKAMEMAGNGCLWCGVGSQIVVLNINTLREVARLEAEPDKAYKSHRTVVSHLVRSPLGIWSACWHANSVQLWDTKTLCRRTAILSLAHDEHARWVQSSADVSALAVSRGVLLIGTEGGSLLLFDIVPRDQDSLTTGSVFRPHFLGCEHIGSGVIGCLVPVEFDIQFSEAFEIPPESSDMDPPLRVICAAGFVGVTVYDPQQAPPVRKSGLRVQRRSKEFEPVEPMKTSLSCWEFRSPQDHDRYQRLRLYHQVLSHRQRRQPFQFPKLTLVRVCPTAVVKTPLED